MVREEASLFKAAAFTGPSRSLQFDGVIRLEVIASEPILLVLIWKLWIHEVCHISIGFSVTTTNYSAVFGHLCRELAVCISGLFDDIRSVVPLTLIIIDPSPPRWLLWLRFNQFLVTFALSVKLNLMWFATLFEAWHSDVSVLCQFRHHEIDDLWTQSASAFGILGVLWGR